MCDSDDSLDCQIIDQLEFKKEPFGPSSQELYVENSSDNSDIEIIEESFASTSNVS